MEWYKISYIILAILFASILLFVTPDKYIDDRMMFSDFHIQNISRYTGEPIDINNKCKDMFNIVKKPLKKQTIVWECSKELPCAGFGDQLRSLTSMFVWANDRNYKFNIQGLEPYPFYPDIFVPNKYDWVNKSSMENSVLMMSLNNCNWDLPHKYVRISTNQQFNDNKECDSWKHQSIKKVLKNWLSNYKPQVRGCGFWFLFKFGSYLKKKLNHYEQKFLAWLNTKSYTHIVSIQIRTGDIVILGNHSVDTSIVDKYLKCAQKLEKKLNFKKTVYFLSSDSVELKRSISNENIYTTDIIPKHTGIQTTGEGYIHDGKDMIAEALVEIIMMAKTNALIRSHSGFGISAAHLGMMQSGQTQLTFPEC